MSEYSINQKLKFLFQIFNKLQNGKEIKLNNNQHTYLIELIKKTFQNLKILKVKK